MEINIRDKHQTLIEHMQQFENATFTPELGIFWYDTKNDELFGDRSFECDTVPFRSDGSRTYNKLHKDVWNRESYKARAQGRATKFSGDYTQIPRGRIFQYDDGHFEVMVGSWINNYPSVKQLVIDRFDLPPDDTQFVVDSHWELGHGWSDEFCC